MSTIDTIDEHTDFQDASIWPTAIKWGVISGAVGIVMTMLFYNMGMMTPESPSGGIVSAIVSIAVGFAILYLGLKEYKEKANAGFLSFGRGVLWSLGFAVIAGLIGSIFSFIFFSFLAPEFITEAMATELAKLEEQGMPDEQIEGAEKMMGMMMNPVAFAGFGFLGQIFYALIEGLIASAILKRDRV